VASLASRSLKSSGSTCTSLGLELTPLSWPASLTGESHAPTTAKPTSSKRLCASLIALKWPRCTGLKLPDSTKAAKKGRSPRPFANAAFNFEVGQDAASGLATAMTDGTGSREAGACGKRSGGTTGALASKAVEAKTIAGAVVAETDGFAARSVINWN